MSKPGRFPRPGAGTVVLVLFSGLFGVTAALAKTVELTPKTNHSILTLNTEDSYGFQVVPGKPLDVEMVGPGDLTIHVRLNHSVKRPVLSGRFIIRAERRLVKKTNMKLTSSRVGAYREDPRIFPSIPEVFHLKVPAGLHSYSFSLRASRGVSMTINFKYESEADQGAAHPDDDPMALVPLVPPKPPEGEKENKDTASQIGDLPIVGLTPPPAVEKPAKSAGGQKKNKGTSEASLTGPVTAKAEVPSRTARKEDRQAGPQKDREAKRTHQTAELDTTRHSASDLKQTAGQRPVVVDTLGPSEQGPREAPARPMQHVSVGIKGGQISPLQKDVGGTTYTASLDLRYILPVADGNLTLGVEGGFYQYEMRYTVHDLDFSTLVIPISLQAYYRLPLFSDLGPFIGLGGAVLVCKVEQSDSKTGFIYESGTAAVFGLHASIGFEAKAGPGFIVFEARAGYSMGDAVVWNKAVNLSGISTVAGYRFIF